MISRKFLITGLVLAVFVLSYTAKALLAERSIDSTPLSACATVVSLAPSITETFFALGLGDKVAGVTKYCDYPPQARDKKKIGGFYDPNYEAIYSLRPDLVVMLPEHGEARQRLTEIGLNVLVVDNKTVDDILASIKTIGATCGAEEIADEWIRGMRERVRTIGRLTEGLSRPAVMVSIGRSMKSNTVKNAYIAGKKGYYDELLGLAGGVNAYQGEIKFPIISREGMIVLNPDVVLDLVPYVEEKGWSAAEILEEWESLAGVKAVKDQRVYVLGRDYVTVPGPRFILLLEDMVRAIHPEVEAEVEGLL